MKQKEKGAFVFPVKSLLRRKRLKGPGHDSWGQELYLFLLLLVSRKLLKSHIRTSRRKRPQLLLKHIAWEQHSKRPFNTKTARSITLLEMEKMLQKNMVAGQPQLP